MKSLLAQAAAQKFASATVVQTDLRTVRTSKVVTLHAQPTMIVQVPSFVTCSIIIAPTLMIVRQLTLPMPNEGYLSALLWCYGW